MKNRHELLRTVGFAVVAGLTACGGGGGDTPPPTVAMIDITAGNRDVVSHATAASIMGLSPTGAIPMASSSSGSARWMSAALQSLNNRAATTLARRERPLAVTGPFDTPCTVSGYVREVDDDRDDNGVPSVGDVITLTYVNCQEAVGETTNGTMTMSLTAISVSPVPSGSARVALSQMAVVTANHSMTIDGSMLLNYALPTTTTPETARMTADGAVTIAVSTHVGYRDTLVLQNGFVEEDIYDSSLGGTTSTVSGRLQSTLAGGMVEVTTLAGAPITKYNADAYPRSGAVQVRGRNGTLQITALSANDVRLDLDADGNGTFESSSTVTWDWLL